MDRDDLRQALTKAIEVLRGWGHEGILAAAVLGFAIVYPIVLITLAAFAWSAPRAAEQPIAFNHKKHVQEVGLGCPDCHEFYEREAFSGLPGPDTCAMCHEEAQTESLEEAKLVELLAQGQPLAWEALFRQPAHVFYSHSRHVSVADIACEQCHGLFGEAEAPPEKVEILSMDACIDCHQKSQASIDCTDCHR